MNNYRGNWSWNKYFLLNSVFTPIYYYILVYLVTFIMVFLYFFINKVNPFIIKLNFSTLWVLVTRYFKQSWLFKLFILQLSGLPPVIIFFIKFNFLVTSLEYVNIMFFVFIFINLLLGMFFYLKIFSTTNTVEDILFLRSLVNNRPILQTSKNSYTNRLY